MSKTDELEKTVRNLRLYENIEARTKTNIPVKYVPCRVSQYKPIAFQHNADNIEDVKRIVESHILSGAEEPVQIFCSHHLDKILRDVIFDMNIIPHVKFTYGSGISRIYTKKFVIQNYGSPCVGNLQYTESEMDPVNQMIEIVTKFQEHMRNSKYISRFDSAVLEFMLKTRPSALF
jgi:hypothetical protein